MPTGLHGRLFDVSPAVELALVILDELVDIGDDTGVVWYQVLGLIARARADREHHLVDEWYEDEGNAPMPLWPDLLRALHDLHDAEMLVLGTWSRAVRMRRNGWRPDGDLDDLLTDSALCHLEVRLP